MDLFDMILGENGLLVELRCNNAFHEPLFAGITRYLDAHIPEWQANGAIPVADASALFNLIDEFAGGSRFWNEAVRRRVEDAAQEIQDLLSTLEP